MNEKVEELLTLRKEIINLRTVRELAFIGFKKEASESSSFYLIDEQAQAYKMLLAYLKNKEDELRKLKDKLNKEELEEYIIQTE